MRTEEVLFFFRLFSLALSVCRAEICLLPGQICKNSNVNFMSLAFHFIKRNYGELFKKNHIKFKWVCRLALDNIFPLTFSDTIHQLSLFISFLFAAYLFAIVIHKVFIQNGVCEGELLLFN